MCSQPSGDRWGSKLSSAYPASRKSLPHHLAFRVLAEAAPLDLAEAVTVPPICQEELYNPGRDVSINPNENSILTPQRPLPDVRLGYTLA